MNNDSTRFSKKQTRDGKRGVSKFLVISVLKLSRRSRSGQPRKQLFRLREGGTLVRVVFPSHRVLVLLSSRRSKRVASVEPGRRRVLLMRRVTASRVRIDGTGRGEDTAAAAEQTARDGCAGSEWAASNRSASEPTAAETAKRVPPAAAVAQPRAKPSRSSAQAQPAARRERAAVRVRAERAAAAAEPTAAEAASRAGQSIAADGMRGADRGASECRHGRALRMRQTAEVPLGLVLVGNR